MSMERPKILAVDPTLAKVYRNNTIEHGVQRGTLPDSTARSARIRKSTDGRNSGMSNFAPSELDGKNPATIDSILRRNNSISIVKKHAIPYAHLHKKTYFNALEKILISPRNVKY